MMVLKDIKKKIQKKHLIIIIFLEKHKIYG